MLPALLGHRQRTHHAVPLVRTQLSRCGPAHPSHQNQNSSNQKPTCSYGGPQKHFSTVAVAAAVAMGEGENCRNHHLQLLQRGNFTVSFDHRLNILLKSWNNSFHPCIIWWDEHCFCKSLFQILCHLTLPKVGCLLFVLLPKALLSLQLFQHHCCHFRGAPCFLSNHHSGCNENGCLALSPQGLSPKYPHSFWWISTKTLNPKPLTLWRTHDIASVGATTRARSTKHTQPSRERASAYYYTCLRRSWMSHWVSSVSYVERRKLTACSLAYGNNTSVTKEMGVVVPSMSNRITLCNQYRWGTLSDSSLQARSSFSSLQIDRCGWFLCSMDKVFATLLQIFRPGFSDVQNCRVRVAVAIPHRAQILKLTKAKEKALE